MASPLPRPFDGSVAPFQDDLGTKVKKVPDSDIASPRFFTNTLNNLQQWHLQVQQLNGRDHNSHLTC